MNGVIIFLKPGSEPKFTRLGGRWQCLSFPWKRESIIFMFVVSPAITMAGSFLNFFSLSLKRKRDIILASNEELQRELVILKKKSVFLVLYRRYNHC